MVTRDSPFHYDGGMSTNLKHSSSFQACVNMKLNSSIVVILSLCKNETEFKNSLSFQACVNMKLNPSIVFHFKLV